MNGEGGWLPTRRRGMAHRTVYREIQRSMVGIRAVVKIIGVAGRAEGRGAGKSVGMTLYALRCRMRACEREAGGVMVECHIRTAGRVTGQTGRVIV